MRIRKETNIPSAFTVDTIIDVYRFTMSSYRVRHENPLVVFDYWQLLYIERGEYTCAIDGDLFCLKEGQALFCEPGGTRYVVGQQNASVAYISFRCASEKMYQFRNRVVNVDDGQWALLSRVLTIGREAFVDIPEDQPFYGQQTAAGTTDYALQTLKNSLELLLLSLAETKEAKPETYAPHCQTNYYTVQFRHMKEYLSHRMSQNVTVEELCMTTGLSRATVKRIFRCCAGMGPIQYFRTMRMKEAKRLIRETDLSITQIAEALGFSGIHHFSRVFKNTTGMSPREYAGSVVPR